MYIHSWSSSATCHPFPPECYPFVHSIQSQMEPPGGQPRKPTLLRRLASHNPDGSPGGARKSRTAQIAGCAARRQDLAERVAHVLWCLACRKRPMGRWPKTRKKSPSKQKERRQIPMEGTPPDMEVVFCSQCPRKLCLPCFSHSAGTKEDREGWVSLDRLCHSGHVYVCRMDGYIRDARVTKPTG